MSGKLRYSLFVGADLAVDFGTDPAQALAYMADNADDLRGADCALMVFDADGMCMVALVDGRGLPGVSSGDGGPVREQALTGHPLGTRPDRPVTSPVPPIMPRRWWTPIVLLPAWIAQQIRETFR